MRETPRTDPIRPKESPTQVCLLGGRAAGKTCLLAGLAILAEAHRQTSVVVRGRDEATIARLDELARTLRARDWPSPTNKSQILHLRVELGNDVIHLSTLDYRGDSFLEELRRLRNDQIEELKAIFDNAGTFLLVLDPHLDLAPLDQAELEARETISSRIQAQLDLIGDSWAERTGEAPGKTRRDVDLAVVLTKIDTLPHVKSSQDARRYCVSRGGALIEKLRNRSDKMAFFPISAVGATQPIERSGRTTIVPSEELTPTGYEPLLRWIVKRHRWRRNHARRRVAGAVAIVATILLALAGLWRLGGRLRIEQILDDPGLSRIEKLELTRTLPPLSGDLARRRGELVGQVIEDLEERINQAATTREVEDLKEIVDKLKRSNPGSRDLEVEELEKRRTSKHENLVFARVEAAFKSQNDNFQALARDYFERFPNGSHKATVDQYVRDDLERQTKLARDRIRAMAVDEPASLAAKAKAILAYVNARYADDPAEVARMRTAAEVALQFCQPRQYRISLKRTGGFVDTRHHKVQLLLRDQPLMDLWSTVEAKEVHWETHSGAAVTIEWRAGEPLTIRLIGAHFIKGESEVGSMTDKSPIAIQLLGGKQTLNVRDEWKNDVAEAFIEFEVEGISLEDWKALSDYVLPGGRW
jgi:hypothetical protein